MCSYVHRFNTQCVCVCMRVCAPCLSLSILIRAFAAAARSFSLPDCSWKHEPSSSLTLSLSYHVCSLLSPSPPVSQPTLGSFLKPERFQELTDLSFPYRSKECERQRCHNKQELPISYSKKLAFIFPFQKVKLSPALLLLTQNKHRAGGAIQMKGTGALQVDSGKPAAYKNLQCGGGGWFQ